MSRGKNGFRRGNRTLAWYLDNKILDRVDQDPERENTPSPPQLNNQHRRKNSFDSDGSLNSNGRQPNEIEERKRRAAKSRLQQQVPVRQRSQNSGSHYFTPPTVEPIMINVSPRGGDSNGSSAPLSISPAQQQTHLFTGLASGQPQSQQPKDREDYWYYDQSSDGFYYEHNGSRGWRRRNPALHGNPPLSVGGMGTAKTAGEEKQPSTQTVEKKVYVPVPVPIYPPPGGQATNKAFPQAGTSPNIKYYDPSSDGFFFEAASVDGWRRRNPGSQMLQQQQQPEQSQRPRVEPSSLLAFPPLGRDLTSQELEELILSNVNQRNAPTASTAPMSHANNTTSNSAQMPFASIVSRNVGGRNVMRQTRPATDSAMPEYPSSSSTVSSSIGDDVTPPPVTTFPAGKENQAYAQQQQQHLYPHQTTKEPLVGSFDDEPYEFYWSEEERTERSTAPGDQASSVGSVDEGVTAPAANPLSAYFNEISINNAEQKAPVKRPNSLKISNPPQAQAQPPVDKRLPLFNVDQFIADLPGNDNFMGLLPANYPPLLGCDSPRTPFIHFPFNRDPASMMFSPTIVPPKETAWGSGGGRFGLRHHHEDTRKTVDKASADIERGLRDIEKIWQSG